MSGRGHHPPTRRVIGRNSRLWAERATAVWHSVGAFHCARFVAMLRYEAIHALARIVLAAATAARHGSPPARPRDGASSTSTPHSSQRRCCLDGASQKSTRTRKKMPPLPARTVMTLDRLGALLAQRLPRCRAARRAPPRSANARRAVPRSLDTRQISDRCLERVRGGGSRPQTLGYRSVA
jgi:hypothetical protein